MAAVVKIKVEMMEETDWRDKHMTALEQYWYMQQHELLTDCVFVVGRGHAQQMFKCHRLVMARASSIFSAMLYGPQANGSVFLEDTDPKIFHHVLKFCYCDAVTFTLSADAVDLCRAAHTFQVWRLVEECVEHLCEHMTYDCVLACLELGNLLERYQLINKSMKMLQEHTGMVLKMPGFARIKPVTLITLLQQDELNVSSEIELIEAVMQWTHMETQRRGLTSDRRGLRAALGPEALSLLRFLCLTAEQFACFEKKLPLLTKTEKLSILLKLSAPAHCEALLDGLSLRTDARIIPKLPNSETYILKRSSLTDKSNNNLKVANFLGCSLSLQVNEPVWMHGCELYTQVKDSSEPPKKKSSEGIDKNKYNEKLKITLLKVSLSDFPKAEILQAPVEVRKVVKYNSTQRIMFHAPILIERVKGYCYCLHIALVRCGSYPIKVTYPVQKYRNIEFRFGVMPHNAFYWGNGGMISSLLFYADLAVEGPPTPASSEECQC